MVIHGIEMFGLEKMNWYLNNMVFIEDTSTGLTKQQLLEYYNRILQELSEGQYPKEMSDNIKGAIERLENEHIKKIS